jgi:hypothetical protein
MTNKRNIKPCFFCNFGTFKYYCETHHKVEDQNDCLYANEDLSFTQLGANVLHWFLCHGLAEL